MSDTEAVPQLKKDVVPSSYREKYAATGGTNGDFIASKLQEITKDGAAALVTVKTENGIPAQKWATFNVGMQRMNLSNVLRSMFLKGETITILGKEFNLTLMKEDANVTLDADKPATFGKLATMLELNDTERTRAALAKFFFPKTPKSTPESRAAAKAERDKAKADEKAKRDAEKAETKAAADKVKADEKAKRDAEKAEAKRVRDEEKAAKKVKADADKAAAAEAKRQADAAKVAAA